MKNRSVRPLRNMSRFCATTCAGRSLLQSVILPEVGDALAAWISSTAGNTGILIGGLAVSYHVKPFVTDDVDLLFLTGDAIPTVVPGFTHDGGQAFRHDIYHVTIDTFSVSSFGGRISDALAKKIVSTAIEDSGMRIVSREGLIAMKLCRSSMRDSAEIVELLSAYPDTSLAEWPIDSEQREHLAILLRHALGEGPP